MVFTLELQIRTLVVMAISLEDQMFFRVMKAALALPTLAVTSLSVPPCLSTVLPRFKCAFEEPLVSFAEINNNNKDL